MLNWEGFTNRELRILLACQEYADGEWPPKFAACCCGAAAGIGMLVPDSVYHWCMGFITALMLIGILKGLGA